MNLFLIKVPQVLEVSVVSLCLYVYLSTHTHICRYINTHTSLSLQFLFAVGACISILMQTSGICSQYTCIYKTKNLYPASVLFCSWLSV